MTERSGKHTSTLLNRGSWDAKNTQPENARNENVRSNAGPENDGTDCNETVRNAFERRVLMSGPVCVWLGGAVVRALDLRLDLL